MQKRGFDYKICAFRLVNRKRGLSSIISTVLIILAAIAAIAIVWGVINSMIGKTSSEVNTEVQYLAIGFIIKDVIQNEECALKFVLQRKAGGGNITGFIIGLEDSNGNAARIDEPYNHTVLTELESTLVEISAAQHGLCQENNDALTKIKVYAILPGAPPSSNPGGSFSINENNDESFAEFETNCGDGFDNDGDTADDCEDSDCTGQSCGENRQCFAGDCYFEISACGSLNTDGEKYILTNDISVGADDCIIINADDIILEGNNKKIIGDNSTRCVSAADKNNITIEHLTVSSCYEGIYFSNVDNSVLRNNNFADNPGSEGAYALRLISGSSSNYIQSNNFTNNELAIYLEQLSEENTFFFNTISGNRNGVYIFYCDDNHFYGNTFSSQDSYDFSCGDESRIYDDGANSAYSATENCVIVL